MSFGSALGVHSRGDFTINALEEDQVEYSAISSENIAGELV